MSLPSRISLHPPLPFLSRLFSPLTCPLLSPFHPPSPPLLLQEQQLEVAGQANSLLSQTVDVSRQKCGLKERENVDRRSVEELQALCRSCADDLVAGLLVMLMALALAGWRRAADRLSAGVMECQAAYEVGGCTCVRGCLSMCWSLYCVLSVGHTARNRIGCAPWRFVLLSAGE